MAENDEDRAQAAECLHKAKMTRIDAEKLTWLMLAKGWLLLLDFRDAAEQKLYAANGLLALRLRNLSDRRPNFPVAKRQHETDAVDRHHNESK